MKNFRISAGGIIIKENKILLVRYAANDSSTFLVGPGGGVNVEEDLAAALKREVLEETGITVAPGKLLLVEDLLSNKYRMLKLWFLCSVVSGEIVKTDEAKIEGIVEASWFSKQDLKNETVYPQIILKHDWDDFAQKDFVAKCLPMKRADF